MGCLVEKTPTGVQIDVHKFDNYGAADNYVRTARGYKFERHEPWAFTPGYDFFQGPGPGERASIYFGSDKIWTASFWVV